MSSNEEIEKRLFFQFLDLKIQICIGKLKKKYQVKDLQSKSLEDATVRSRLTIYLTLLSSSNYKEGLI